VVSAPYRPHGTVAAGAVAIAAGVYEFTPLKQHFRRRCRDSARSGFPFGLCCTGSSIGLIAMLVALRVMSPTLMAMIAVLVLAQQLLPVKAAVDTPLALMTVRLGLDRPRALAGSRARTTDVKHHRHARQARLL
jgi:predicted metal-binding membrane protein